MTKEELQGLISNPKRADKSDLDELLQLSRQYPYCAPLQSIILAALHRVNDLRFMSELHERALTLPDLRKLFSLLNSDTSTVVNSRTVTETAEEEEGFGLIDAFLESHPEDSAEIEQLLNPDLCLKPNDRTTPAVEGNSDDADEIINTFLEQGNKAEQIAPLIPPSAVSEETVKKPQANELLESEDELFTETLARMYIKQGKFERAERILRQIYLEFPEKSGYFAEQLNFLEKLVKLSEGNRN